MLCLAFPLVSVIYSSKIRIINLIRWLRDQRPATTNGDACKRIHWQQHQTPALRIRAALNRTYPNAFHRSSRWAREPSVYHNHRVEQKYDNGSNFLLFHVYVRHRFVKLWILSTSNFRSENLLKYRKTRKTRQRRFSAEQLSAGKTSRVSFWYSRTSFRLGTASCTSTHILAHSGCSSRNLQQNLNLGLHVA